MNKKQNVLILTMSRNLSRKLNERQLKKHTRNMNHPGIKYRLLKGTMVTSVDVDMIKGESNITVQYDTTLTKEPTEEQVHNLNKLKKILGEDVGLYSNPELIL